jgi:hypothetical protein
MEVHFISYIEQISFHFQYVFNDLRKFCVYEKNRTKHRNTIYAKMKIFLLLQNVVRVNNITLNVIFFIFLYWFQPALRHLGIPRDIYRGCKLIAFTNLILKF